MLQSLQACRAIAALLVLLFHMGGTFAQAKYFGSSVFDRLFGWGDAGADLFFVLSGFIITTTHRGDVGRPQRLARYVRRRLTRIYPTYWIVFLAVFAASLALPGLQSVPTDAWIVLKSLLLLPQDPAVVGGTGAPVLFVAWTLQYELLFYTVMACLIASRIAGGLAIATLLALQIACHLGMPCPFPLSFLSSHLIWLFAFGAFTALAVERPAMQFARPLLVACIGAIAMVVFGLSEISWLPKSLFIERSLVYGAFAALIMMALVQAERRGAFPTQRPWIGLLGDSSYALYLLHIPVISICVKLAVAIGLRGPWWGSTAAFVVTAAACIAAGCLFHAWLERPLLRALSARPAPRVAPALANE